MTTSATTIERPVTALNTSTNTTVFYFETVNEDVDEGNYTTVADFRILEGGGVDLDELIAHL